MHKEIYDLNDILTTDADMVFFDLEDTLIASNIFYDLIGHQDYCKLFLDLCKGVKVFEVTYLGKNFRRVLMQKDIPKIINKLREEGKKIFILTSGFPSYYKKLKVKQKGIKVDGFLFTKGKDKGPFLKNFLSMNNLSGKCAFIDNHYEKIYSVGNSFEQDDIDLFLYKKEFVHKITKEDFIKYWTDVINAVKKGDLKKIKQSFDLYLKKKHQNSKENPIQNLESDEEEY